MPRRNDETIGSHHICIKMWPNGVGKGPNFCEQTGQSDWCQERKPCHEDESQECGIQNWCISRGAWAKYVEKVGCDDAVDLHCDSVNQKALEACALDYIQPLKSSSRPAPFPLNFAAPHASHCLCRAPADAPPAGSWRRRVLPCRVSCSARVPQQQMPLRSLHQDEHENPPRDLGAGRAISLHGRMPTSFIDRASLLYSVCGFYRPMCEKLNERLLVLARIRS